MCSLAGAALAQDQSRGDPAKRRVEGPNAPPASVAAVEDAMFAQPYIDIDEWRDAPVRHRYVHGGFKGTDTRFSFYFPPKAQYQGRFFQYVTPVPDSENLSQGAKGEEDKIGFSVSSGAYFVETNGGGAASTGAPGSRVDPTIAAYRANAASAQYSRTLAEQMYGPKRPYGYLFGGSGGGYRTLGSMENTEGVWDGAVPFVIGSPMAIPNMFTVRMYAQRVLGDRLALVADAADAGGSGDLYAGLNGEQRAALTEITRMGFPPRGWYAWKTMGMGAFPVLYPGVAAADPGYFTDFWTKPGYEGFNPPPSLIDARIQYKAKVVKLITAADANAMGLKIRPQMGQARGSANSAWQAMIGPGGAQLPVGFQLDSVPKETVSGADLLVNTGAAAGKRLPMQRVENNVVLLGGGVFGNGADAAAKVQVGDEVQIDNSNFLAAQTYHRHQVPSAEYHAWDQFRGPDGKPIYPQRPMLLGPLFTKATSGTINTGKFHGKMILLENMMDIDALPWQGDWYRQRARDNLGPQLEDNLRLWYTDRANHGDNTHPGDATQVVSYLGVLQQALRDVSAWVEKGVPPPATTNYRIVDSQVVTPSTAGERRGIQPVIRLTANGAARAEVGVGQPVAFAATVDVPPGTGKLVSAEWDFDGAGTFPEKAKFKPAGHEALKVSHAFAKPGTYFAVLRVASQRQGDANTPFTRIRNLERVRIVVK
jgi:hypothetical protein